MDADVQEHVAFYLTGRGDRPGLSSIDGLALRPAALAGRRDLASLRHDYPLILVNATASTGAADDASVVSLSGLVDGLTAVVGQGPDADRVRGHALSLEAAIRKAAFAGGKGALSAMWDAAVRARPADDDPAWKDDVAKLRAACKFDGEVVCCDSDLPIRLVAHVWKGVEAQKARRARATIDRLALKLGDILRADDAGAVEGQSAGRLRACLATSFADDIDVSAMSRLLTAGKPVVRLPATRRARIEKLVATLRSQAFFPPQGGTAPAAAKNGAAHEFVFHSGREALQAYRARMPRMVELAKAMAVAELEIDGAYRESTHDAMFDAIGAEELGASELAQFPDYLVCVGADAMSASDGADLMEALSSGLPMKVLLQTDDLVAPVETAAGRSSTGLRVRRLANSAIGLAGAFVLQTSSAHLYRFRERLRRGLAFDGPALVSVYSGAGGAFSDMHPYLAAAAATECRALPSFVYDPSAGEDWASRFALDHNPQPERDWPVHRVEWEDESLQRQSADVAFTPADFLACDARYARHFARVPKASWNGTMIPVPESAANEAQGLPTRVPFAFVVDRDDKLQRVLVDAKLIRETRRLREQWRSLQELGGIRNSHAERALAKERKALEERAAAEAQARAETAAPATQPAQAAPAVAAETTPVAAATAPTRDPDEPYIETARCSTCNECTHINDRMFKYDQNKQAYIADPKAGTFAQLVEAAESCQVAVIHPGKPKNPAEPNLDALLKRAAAFV